MNHLRELLDLLPAKVALDQRWALQLDQRLELGRALVHARHLGERAVCFAIGDINQAVSLAVIPELCRLPYKICWFEALVLQAESGQGFVGMLCIEDDGGFNAMVFSRVPGTGRWVFEGALESDALSSIDMATYCPSQAENIRFIIQTMTYGVKAFLSALHCSNVQRHKHVPDDKLQRARAKRGKAPLFSYWTLELDNKSARGENQGGTHASPRVHLRRGHPRQYAPGQWTWVQAHAVGNRAAGMVHKDYSAGSGLAVAAR